MLFNGYVESRQALKEVHIILNNTRLKDLTKIPVSFIKFIEENEDKNYEPVINFNTPLENQKLKKETLNILSMIYLKYWCENEEQKNNFLKLLKKNEETYQEELRKQYNPEELFKNRESTQKIAEVTNEEVSASKNLPIEVKKTNIFQRIINWIKKFIR